MRGWILAVVGFAVSLGFSAERPGNFSRDARILRFLSPWTNTSPSVVYNGGADTTAMKAVENYCGWFQASLSTDAGDVVFVQTVGSGTYGAEGTSSVGLIDLSEYESVGDTIWVNSNGGTAPTISSSYPNVLGECPSRKLSVMMFDWYDGSRDNHEKYNPKTRRSELCSYGSYDHCTRTYGGEGVSADFGGDNVNLCWPNSPVSSKAYYEEDRNLTDYASSVGKVLEGMVLPNLGANGVPVRNESFDWKGKCKNAEHLNRWFIPETLVVKDGKSYTNATCRDLSLILDDDGIWRGQMDRSTDSSTGEARGGMFLLDDFQYLDEERTIPNPYYDSIPSGFEGVDGSGKYSNKAFHNYGLSMKIQANFVYVPGQYFEFLGDDDVWVFIDGRLAVDIGGVHDRRSRAVNLDTIGRSTGDTLVPGETYNFDIFYTERYKVEGNFKMRTSIDLHTSIKYYSMKDYSLSSGTTKAYTIMQNVRTDGLSCDYSVTTEDSPAPSYFKIYGGNLPSEGQSLASGTHYGGITINGTMSGFSIDTTAIAGLLPGTYTFEFTSQADAGASKSIRFTVPETAAPEISLVFADSLYEAIDADTATLGEWAGVLYPVYVALDYDTLLDAELFLAGTSPSLVFVDSTGANVSSVQMVNGRAHFYVMATDPVSDAAFMVRSGSIGNVLVWGGISLSDPPVPKLSWAGMFDRDGDGVADSLAIRFSRPPVGDDAPDSVLWTFGVPGSAPFGNFSAEDSVTVSLVSLSGFTPSVFTGASEGVFAGSVSARYTMEGSPFRLDGVLEDRVGAILQGASILPEEDVSILTLDVSEALSDSQLAEVPLLFEFRRYRSGTLSEGTISASSWRRESGSRVRLYYHVLSGDAPSPGDSVRLVPGVALDLSGNVPHVWNPWIRITGGGYVDMAASTVVSVDPTTAPSADSRSVEPLVVSSEESAESVSRSIGRHGQLISFDGVLGTLEDANAELAAGEAPYTLENVEISYETRYFTNLGEFVNASSGTLSCTDSLFGGDCTSGGKGLFLAWNMRSSSGRLAGTGAYIAQSEVRILVGDRVLKSSQENVWGVKRTPTGAKFY